MSKPGGLSLMAIKLHHSIAVHPGLWLRAQIVEPAGLSVTALAERPRVTRQAASNLLNGNDLLVETARIHINLFDLCFAVTIRSLHNCRIRIRHGDGIASSAVIQFNVHNPRSFKSLSS